MISVRPGKMTDLLGIQDCNVSCLPENYTFKYYYYHYLNWPDLIFIAEDTQKNKIVGYVIGKIDEEGDSTLKQKKGHITSLSVLRDYRRFGIAGRLMEAIHRAMFGVFRLTLVTLHVRESNDAALGLYKDRLKYEVVKIDENYYADDENAYFMKKILIDGYPQFEIEGK